MSGKIIKTATDVAASGPRHPEMKTSLTSRRQKGDVQKAAALSISGRSCTNVNTGFSFFINIAWHQGGARNVAEQRRVRLDIPGSIPGTRIFHIIHTSSILIVYTVALLEYPVFYV